MAKTALLFLDTETTGLIPTRHTPWEIAWATAVHDTEASTLTVLHRSVSLVVLDREDTEYADPAALAIGRFQERYSAADAQDPGSIVRHMHLSINWALNHVGQSNPIHLVGAVPSFDHAMICQNWTGWPGFGEGLWHYHLIDVEVLAAGKLGVAPPWKSHELTAMLGVSVDPAAEHTASGDVQWAIDTYAAVYDLIVV